MTTLFRFDITHTHKTVTSLPPSHSTAVDLSVHVRLLDHHHHQHFTHTHHTPAPPHTRTQMANRERRGGSVGGNKSKDIEHLVLRSSLCWTEPTDRSATPKEGGAVQSVTLLCAADREQTTVHLC